uniref:Uncharacterized protein n=1 Tax=Lactuca sativa TaxID=4236 RepID=A0A9R1XTJ9_LACSA|nr:hypothetical protein LSAT_V11C100018270 [Lactuca sativa]
MLPCVQAFIKMSWVAFSGDKKGIIDFRFPNPCNVNDTDWVPEEREDEWMEVKVWQFNSSNKIRDDWVSINLKLISYEGTMSGLIVSSLEFRLM